MIHFNYWLRSSVATQPRFALLLALGSILLCTVVQPRALAEPVGEIVDPEPLIEAVRERPADARIAERIRNIYQQIEALADVGVDVREGVVMLSGTVANDKQAQRALALAIRLEGVVTVDDAIDRTMDLQGNVLPLLDQFKSDLQSYSRAIPLLLVALLSFFCIAFAGHILAKWSSLWQRVAPNHFLAQLMAQAVRVITLLFGFVFALNLVGATALMGTILGGAGVLGIAIGFAVRDSMENYISSIMLSLRQPFRANDHVIIDQHEGKVIRLTSRATILMTLDGNHLRIPNSTVFKGVILNFSSNPERRFDFELGVDADDDPIAAMKTGLDAIRELEFVLGEPGPNAIITTVGDSNIVIRFMGWVNQSQSDFGRTRSLAIRAAMAALAEQGFTLPEPIYRLRFDQPLAANKLEGELQSSEPARANAAPRPSPPSMSDEHDDTILNVAPDTHLEEKVNTERFASSEQDLLDQNRPVE
ncbi:MAG: mechanosensitive ion channel [Pseudomonadales bacterium]|nr:mechanosensitive ion channel [Pseudomonadales bacterium]